MNLHAKFPSICPICNQPINEGDAIMWEPGQKARHPACVDTHQENQAVAKKTMDAQNIDIKDLLGPAEMTKYECERCGNVIEVPKSYKEQIMTECPADEGGCGRPSMFKRINDEPKTIKDKEDIAPPEDNAEVIEDIKELDQIITTLKKLSQQTLL